MVEDASILVYQQVANEVNSEIHFDLQKLQQLPNYHAYLYSWLKNYGFSDWTAIQDLVESQTGKQVFSPSFRLLKDRSNLILSPNAEQLEGDFFIEKGQMEVKIPLNMILCKVTDISKSSSPINSFVEIKLWFPFQIRKSSYCNFVHTFVMIVQSKK